MTNAFIQAKAKLFQEGYSASNKSWLDGDRKRMYLEDTALFSEDSTSARLRSRGLFSGAAIGVGDTHRFISNVVLDPALAIYIWSLSQRGFCIRCVIRRSPISKKTLCRQPALQSCHGPPSGLY